jgi:putative glutamine amidotransferase
MTTDLPRIAIPEPTSTDTAYNQRSLPQYVHALVSAGGIAVPIPLHEPAAGQQRLLRTCAGVLLPGSPADVDPGRYGQARAKETAERDQLRETTDDLLLRDAFEHKKPVLGICFGLQSLNVFRKGTLIQHLPDDPAANMVKHDAGREIVEAHPVKLAAGSKLATLISAGSLAVNSSHHQAVDRPGDALKVTAVSPDDGVIEAVEGESPDSFLLAVQWHPERTYEQSVVSRAIFGTFLDSARKWMLAAGS